ncbi:MAG: hypothetical protein NVSMB45_07710 [Ginsengibacter sp.]
MSSIFSQGHSAELVARLNKLTPESKAKWGKMNVSQMLAHLQQPLKLTLGEKKLKRSLVGFLFGKMAKKKMLGEAGFSKNLPTVPSFIIKVPRNFEQERTTTIEYLTRLTSGGPDVLTREAHPFFGKMTENDWDKLNWKHIDHHLRQFGV